MQRIICLLCLALSMAMAYSLTTLPTGSLTVHALDVGQGDALFLQTPGGATILVDGGPNLSVLSALPKHLPRLHPVVDLVILTHPDADHITALPEVLRRYDVRHVLLNGKSHHSGRYRELLAVAQEKGVHVLVANPQTDLAFSDGTVLDVIWPPPGGLKHLSANNNSVVLRILHKDTSILLTGDIEEEAEHAILAMGADIQSDILKVAHHGSKTSSSTGFLLATSPSLGLISSGKDNPFGHPHQMVVDRLRHFGINIKNTADEGGISLVFNSD